MTIRTARAEWKGNLAAGSGTVETESGALNTSYSKSRFEGGQESNPEELIGAAHAACFSMAFSHGLAEAGFEPKRVATSARVHLEKGSSGFSVTRIELVCEAEVPGIPDGKFQEAATAAKEGCPISKALSAVPIELDARLLPS